jgi:signal transduction histidine kinase
MAAMDGKTTFSENFGAFVGEPSITVAAPITLSNGEIGGVVLLHEQIENIRGATESGLGIMLLSMGAAVIISFFIANAWAWRFTKPLGKMKTAALRISGGDYAVKIDVAQDDEIGELAAALDDMAEKLDAASKEGAKLEKLRRDFVANISHELRTPVTVIRGSLEALCDGVVSEPQLVEDYHRQMLSESAYLERLVSDLLDLARLQNPDFTMEMSEVNLKDIAEDAIRSMARIARRRTSR